MLENITTPLLFTYLLVFCRVGTTIMLLPGLSEGYIAPRARLILALGLSLAIIPTIQPLMPVMPTSGVEFFLLIAKEILVGAFIGTVVKVLFSALHVAGMVIATQTGLAAAMMFDPTQGEQNSAIGMFLMLLGIMIIFAGDIHHLFIMSIVDSYSLFPPMDELPMGGFSDLVSKTASTAFSMGVRISAPVIVIGLVIYLGGGVMGRLMPQMQVFFVLTPIQILLGFSMLILTLSTGMMWFMSYYTDTVANFLR